MIVQAFNETLLILSTKVFENYDQRTAVKFLILFLNVIETTKKES